jgi:perosamine synthetase
MPEIIREIFENYVKDTFDLNDCIAVNNGTSALIAPLWSMDFQDGDEVITTPFTFIATTNAIIIAGAKPVFVDINPNTLLIDVDKIEESITPKTNDYGTNSFQS